MVLVLCTFSVSPLKAMKVWNQSSWNWRWWAVLVDSAISSANSQWETLVVCKAVIAPADGHGKAWGQGASCACEWQPLQAAGADIRALQIREHVFWCCPFAQGEVGVLKANLPEDVALLPLRLWLLLPPCTSLHPSAWWAVCLCALGTMR